MLLQPLVLGLCLALTHPHSAPSLSPAASQAGKAKGSVAVGRYLAETVASVPHFQREEFEKLMQVRWHELMV